MASDTASGAGIDQRSPTAPQGMSNRDIAHQLVVSEHTGHRHVSNILTKLDEPSRSAAVAHAIGAGLI